MTGANSSKFVTNYGFFVSPGNYNNTAGCDVHDLPQPALDERGKGDTGSKSGLPSGTYATMFFIRAPYNPASGTAGSNQTAQFCRQCHGGEVERDERRHRGNYFLDSLCMRGGGVLSLPFLLSGGHLYEVQILPFFDFFFWVSGAAVAQVSSHAPTVFTQAPAQSAARPAQLPADKPVARVNSAVLTRLPTWFAKNTRFFRMPASITGFPKTSKSRFAMAP